MPVQRHNRAEVRYHRFRMIAHRAREAKAVWPEDERLEDKRVLGKCAKRHAFFSCGCTSRGMCKMHKRKGFEKLQPRRVVPFRVLQAEWLADGQLEGGEALYA